MQKWEYSFVFATVTNDGEFRPRFANDGELDDWQAGLTMYDYANRLGESGWELWTAPLRPDSEGGQLLQNVVD